MGITAQKKIVESYFKQEQIKYWIYSPEFSLIINKLLLFHIYCFYQSAQQDGKIVMIKVF